MNADVLALFGGPPVRTASFPAWPQASKDDIKALTRVLMSGSWGGAPEPNTEAAAFAAAFADKHDCAYGICCSVGTEANRIAMRAAGLRSGQEVIIPALNWISPVTAVTADGADPVVVDIDESTHLMDLNLLQEALSPRTAGVVSMHYTGRIVPPEPIIEFCKSNGLFYVEDCAQAHGGRWLGRSVGSFGDAAAFSFQETKILTSGEGGLVATNNAEVADAAHAMVNNNRQLPSFRHEIRFPEVTNARITELQAALLSSQLELFESRHITRERNAALLHEHVAQIDGVSSLRPDERETSAAYWKFVILLGPELQAVSKNIFVRALAAEGIPADPGTPPVHRHHRTQLSRSNWTLVSREEGNRAARLPVVEHLVGQVHVWLHQRVLLGDTKAITDIATAIDKVRIGLLGKHRREAMELGKTLPKVWYEAPDL